MVAWCALPEIQKNNFALKTAWSGGIYVTAVRWVGAFDFELMEDECTFWWAGYAALNQRLGSTLQRVFF
jgi:hypothetical protein